MDEPHEREADRLEKDADHLETAGDAVDGEVKDLREDWDAKKKSQQSPGAMDEADAAPGGLGEAEEDEDESSDEDDSDDADSEDEDYESGDDSR
jgi:hypothetical protein